MESFDEKFDQLDADNDGMLSVFDAEQILTILQIPYYPGMLEQTILANSENQENEGLIRKDILRTFCEYKLNGLGQLFMFDLQIMQLVKQFKIKMHQLKGQQQKQQAAPGGLSQDYRQQNIKAKIQVGDDTHYTSKIDLQIIKTSSQEQVQPQIIFTLQPRPNMSKQLVSTITDFIEMLTQFVESQAQQMKSILEVIKIQVTQEANDVVQIKIRSQSKQINKTIQSFITIPDKLLDNNNVCGNLRFIFQSSLNLNKMFAGDQNSIIDYLFSSYRLDLNYKGSSQLSKLFYSLGYFADYFDHLKSIRNNAYSPFQNVLLFCCFSQDIDIDLKFDNVQQAKNHLKSTDKEQLQGLQNQFLHQMHGIIKQGQQHPVFSFIPQAVDALSKYCTSSVKLSATFSKVSINAQIQIKDLGHLYKKVMSHEQNDG